MEAVYFTEADFYLQQQLLDRRWKVASIVAVIFHLSVFAAALYLPAIIDRKPLIEEVITVDLLSMPEPAEIAPPTPPQPLAPEPEISKPEPPPPEPEPQPVAPEVVVPPEPAPPPPVVKAKPISIKPAKRKIKKAKDTRLAEEKNREKKIVQQKKQARERRQAIARAKEQEKRALEEAQRAREALASVIRETQSVKQPTKSRQNNQSSSGKKVESIVEKQYMSIINQRIQSYWVLPEMRNWDNSLEAIVLITIDKDGRVLNIMFERHSSDPFFDQFVEKTINNAVPMPRFPKLLKKASVEVGLIFRPGDLIM